MDHDIVVPPDQLADYLFERVGDLANSRTAQIAIPVPKLNAIIQHLRMLDTLQRGGTVEMLAPPDYALAKFKLEPVADPAFEARAGAIGECEAFLNHILINREFSYSLKPNTDWQRLPFGPVTGIKADALAYSVDIDSAANGWVRQSEAMAGTILYDAGMAVEFDDLPDPLKQAVERLEQHRITHPKGDLPAVVTALLRPYRRVTLP